MSGIELVGEIRKANPRARIVFWTSEIGDEELLKAALKAGADSATFKNPLVLRVLPQELEKLG